jgi:hypothetical protein
VSEQNLLFSNNDNSFNNETMKRSLLTRFIHNKYNSLEASQLDENYLCFIHNNNQISINSLIYYEYSAFRNSIVDDHFLHIINKIYDATSTPNQIHAERYIYLKHYMQLRTKYISRAMIQDIEKDLTCIYGYEDISNIPKEIILDALIMEFKTQPTFREFLAKRRWYTDQTIIQHLCLSARDKTLLQNIGRKFSSNDFLNFGEKYSYIYSIRFNTLPKFLRPLFIKLLQSLIGFYDEDTWMDLLKDFGTLCLRHYIEDGLPSWVLFFVELHMLSGYDTVKHVDIDPISQCSPFYTDRVPDASFKTRVLNMGKHLIKNIEIKRYPNLTLNNWISFPDNFAIFGAGNYGNKMVIHTEDIKKPYKDGTKFGRFWSKPLDWWDSQLRTIQPHQVDVFLKTDELAKTRYVMGYDMLSFIRLSMFYYCLGNLNKKKRWTTIDLTPNQLYSLQVEEINQLSSDNKRFWYLCTDQSAFDQHVYKDILIELLEYLLDQICRVNPQLKPIRDVELESMKLAEINIGKNKYSWKNGLCSGHKFTGLLGSIINGAVSLVIAEEANLNVERYLFQGDDAYLVTRNQPDKNKIAALYRKYDLDVNPMKTWVSQNRFEYLHQIYDGTRRIRSLPNRGLAGLIWKNPKAVEPGILNQIHSSLDLIEMLSRRGNIVKRRGYGYIIAELKRNNPDLSSRDIYNWLHTPKPCGGGNCLPYVDSKYWTKIIDNPYSNETVKTEIISPYRSIAGVDVQKWILKRMYDHIPQPKILHHLQLIRVGATPKRMPNNSRLKIDLHISFDPFIKDNTHNFLNRMRFDLGEYRVEVKGRDRTSAYLDYIRAKEYTFQHSNFVREIRDRSLSLHLTKIWDRALLNFNYCFIYNNSEFDRIWNYYHSIIYNYIKNHSSVYDPSLSRIYLKSNIVIYHV